MTRKTKQDKVVRYALLRGKLLPRDEVLLATKKENAKSVLDKKLSKAELDANDNVDNEDVDVKDNVEDKDEVVEAKPKTTRKPAAKKPAKSESKDDDFAIEIGDQDADTKKV